MRTLLLLATSFVLLAGTASSQAPPGYRSFDHKGTGLRLHYPKRFKPIPPQPTEKLVIAKFVRNQPYLAGKKVRGRSPETIEVFVLSNRTTTSGQGEEPSATGEATSLEDMVRRRNLIHFYRDFMKSRHRGWSLKPVAEDDEDRVKEFELSHERTKRRGYLWVREVWGKTVGVVGYADEPAYDAMVKRFRRVANSIEKPKGYARVRDDSSRVYEGKNFRDVPFRIEARRAMIKGWKPYDTENFFIVYHTKNTALVKKVANDLEAIRPLYIEHFPPAKPIEAVSVVRICRDAAEYAKYGGPRGSAGYWNPAAKELVLYDFTYRPPNAGTNRKSRKASDSYIVLYHEAFHQYIYYAAGEISPHYWFNEGLGDFFSGTTIYRGSKKIKGVDLNRWRIHYIKSLVDQDKYIPFKDILFADRNRFYNPRIRGAMYAEAWSFCYFLLKTKVTEKRPEWRSIIDRYFNSLKAAHAKYVGGLPETATLKEKSEAEKKAREEAIKTALDQVDLDELEDAWSEWLKKTKDPWATQRKRR